MGPDRDPLRDLTTDVLQFVATSCRVTLERLTLDMSLFHDLGVDGIDGWELMAAYSRQFGVDMSAFQANLHFGPEGSNPFVTMFYLLTDSPKLYMIPITIADLVEAARTGHWQTPVRAPRRAV